MTATWEFKTIQFQVTPHGLKGRKGWLLTSHGLPVACVVVVDEDSYEAYCFGPPNRRKEQLGVRIAMVGIPNVEEAKREAFNTASDLGWTIDRVTESKEGAAP